MFDVLAWIALSLGATFCVHSFYLSFLRYPLHRLRGLSPESYRRESGIPVFGSVFVALSLFRLHSVAWVVPTAIALIVADTGGIHWFVGVIIYQWLRTGRSG
jgi:hypothetical protein